MADAPPPINEIVALLSKHSPGALQKLGEKYPESAALLRVGEIAGKTDKQTQLRAEAALVALQAGIGVCERRIPELRKKIRGESKLQFIGQLLTIIGGASIFGLLALDNPKGAKYVAAILTLLGAVSSLTAQQMGKALHAAAGSLFDIYRTLVECHLSARQLLTEIEPWVKSNFAGSSKADLITKANEVCFRITQAESEV
ncbi:MAG TPA: hypothetical protein VGV59_05720 [Pyrinomonadaceae bacterium]|nr:hypothetical protein [Pyrinomonadaceae bacterium]